MKALGSTPDQEQDTDVAAEAKVVRGICQSYCAAFSKGLEGKHLTAASVAPLPPGGLHLFGLRKVYPAPTSCLGALSRCRWPWSRKDECRNPDPSAPVSLSNLRVGEGNLTEDGFHDASFMEPPVSNEAIVSGEGTRQNEGQDPTPSSGHVSKDHVAVVGTWLSVPEGQCFCLLGPNGAGKTTTLRCLIGVSERASDKPGRLKELSKLAVVMPITGQNVHP